VLICGKILGMYILFYFVARPFNAAMESPGSAVRSKSQSLWVYTHGAGTCICVLGQVISKIILPFIFMQYALIIPAIARVKRIK